MDPIIQGLLAKSFPLWGRIDFVFEAKSLPRDFLFAPSLPGLTTSPKITCIRKGSLLFPSCPCLAVRSQDRLPRFSIQHPPIYRNLESCL